MRNGFRRCAHVILALLALLCFAWAGFTAYVAMVHFPGGPPASVGNRPDVRDRVPPFSPDAPFSFAAVGDIRADETFDALARELRSEKLAFLVLLGDAVRDPTEVDHRFLQAKMRGVWDLPFPVFYVPGNHDVDQQSFPLERFRALYGETCFTLARGPYRFIFLEVLPAPYDNNESLAFLARELAEAAKASATVFVFGHCSPHVSSPVTGRPFSGEERLLDLLARYRAAYYVGGDFHGYCRTTVGPTTYMTAGGGGSPLKAPGAFGFHHVAVFTLENGNAVERLCVATPRWRLDERPRYFAMAWFARAGWGAIAIPGVIGILALVALRYGVRPRQHGFPSRCR
jgi:hypothetical protein